MLQKAYPAPVKLVCGFLYSSQSNYRKAKDILTKKFGKIDYESEIIDFTFTDYYAKEMGEGLKRRFISFAKLQKPDTFSRIKSLCINVERKFLLKNSREKRRTVNIDPGYINESKLVLTTTKDFSHRIYIGKGIYAEVTLLYNKKEKNFIDLSTTFPDYRTLVYKRILLTIRGLYSKQIKHA